MIDFDRLGTPWYKRCLRDQGNALIEIRIATVYSSLLDSDHSYLNQRSKLISSAYFRFVINGRRWASAMLFITTRINAEVATIAYPVSWREELCSLHWKSISLFYVVSSLSVLKREKTSRKGKFVECACNWARGEYEATACDHAKDFALMRACATRRTVRGVTHPNCVTHASQGRFG